MKRPLVHCLGLGLFVGAFGCALTPLTGPELEGLLSFESVAPFGGSLGWWGGPPSTLHIDSVVVHSGRRSGRIERNRSSQGEFSTFTRSMPLAVQGRTLELRGWMKFEDVSGGVGLWQRQDGSSGSLQFDNMSSRGLRGTSDWKEYRLELPLDPRARSVYFGCLLSGTGRVWVDDMQLLVDGRPIHQAPVRATATPRLESDHEFDGGSRLADRVPTRVEVENLVALGKVWGFLKYHHPKVTSGDLHWDYELFRIAPRVLEARARAAGLDSIARWVGTIGDPAPCAPCGVVPRDPVLAPRLEWIADSVGLGAKLSRSLRRIHRDRDADGEQHFVGQVPGVRNPDFAAENAYTMLQAPDAGFRLLALFRFWNIIEYWFPYRDVMNEDWDRVLAEYIPRTLQPAARDEYARSMMTLVARIHDGHANVWSERARRPPVGDWYVPVQVRFVEGRAVISRIPDLTYAHESGLEVGDMIRSLDGVPLDSLIARWEPFYGVSNRAALEREIARSLTNGDSAVATLGIERDGRSLTRPVLRARRPDRSTPRPGVDTHDHAGPAFRRLSDDLAYLKLSSVRSADAVSYVRRAQGTRCLVIDIRNYPSESTVFELGRLLVRERTPFAKFTVGDLRNPGAFTWKQGTSIEPGEPRFEGRVAILVDEISQSHAEFTAMAFRSAPGAIVVGSTTAGADGNVSAVPLPGGLRAMISGIGVYYPDGRPTQRIGIVPDRTVRPTIPGLRANRDEVLEAAVREVLGRGLTDDERKTLAAPEPGQDAIPD